MDWDTYFMALCDTVALKSKDESTQLGCVVVGPGREIRATGYNSFPRGVNDDVPKRQQRPLKYSWMAHAEANAIYNAARCGVSLSECVLYCQWLPCPSCAMGIIGAGIHCVVVRTFDVPKRWRTDMVISNQMLEEAGVEIRSV